jgi:HSP20 family molecular chaperone IbpA
MFHAPLTLTHLISQPFAWPTLPVEQFDEHDEHVVRVEAPGLNAAADLRVVVYGGELRVHTDRGRAPVRRRSEFRYGVATCRVTLPRGVDPDSIVARYRDGILEVRMRVLPADPRTIEVKEA